MRSWLSYWPLQKQKGSFLIQWSEANLRRQQLGSPRTYQLMMTRSKMERQDARDTGKTKQQRKSTDLRQRMNCVHKAKSFPTTHHCLFYPIQYTTMTKTLILLMAQKLLLQNCPQRGAFQDIQDRDLNDLQNWLLQIQGLAVDGFMRQKHVLWVKILTLPLASCISHVSNLNF